ncbi:unnamed protein product [Ixodes hexagonus]
MDLLRRLLRKVFLRGTGAFVDAGHRTESTDDSEGSSGATEAVDLTMSLHDDPLTPLRKDHSVHAQDSAYAPGRLVPQPILSPSGPQLGGRLLDAMDPYYSINTNIVDVSFADECTEDSGSTRSVTNWFMRDFLSDTSDSFQESVIGVPVMLDPAVVTEFQDIFS